MPSAGLHPVEIRAVFGEQEPPSDITLVAVSCFSAKTTRTGNLSGRGNRIGQTVKGHGEARVCTQDTEGASSLKVHKRSVLQHDAECQTGRRWPKMIGMESEKGCFSLKGISCSLRDNNNQR